MTPMQQIKLGVLAILIVSIAWCGWYVRDLRADNAVLKNAQESMLARMKDAERDIGRLDDTLAKRDEINAGIRDGIADITVRIKQEKANDPPLRAYLDTRIPDGLRKPYREAAARATAISQNADSTNAD